MILDVRCLDDNIKRFGDQDIQLDRTDGSQSCLINICGNTKFLIAKDICDTVK